MIEFAIEVVPQDILVLEYDTTITELLIEGRKLFKHLRLLE